MHGLYINRDDDLTSFVLNLFKFASGLDYNEEKSEPYAKYVNNGFEKSVMYTYTIDDIKRKSSGIKKLSFLRDEPIFKFRIVFTDNPNASNALHCYSDNRITIIIKSDYTDKNKDIEQALKNSSILGTVCHELTHAFDYSKAPKSYLDTNKDHVYHEAKKELGLGKDYTRCKLSLDDVIKNPQEIIKFYYTILYYTQQTEMNAYLRSFQNEVTENVDVPITDIDIYRRYNFFCDFLNSFSNYASKDEIVDKLRHSSYPTCFGKVNGVLNNSSLSTEDKLRKINFIINRNYIEYEKSRFMKIYHDIKSGVLNEHTLDNIFSFNDFIRNTDTEVEEI